MTEKKKSPKDDPEESLKRLKTTNPDIYRHIVALIRACAK